MRTGTCESRPSRTGCAPAPWHHARFEISCGDTLEPFADDAGVPDAVPVEVGTDFGVRYRQDGWGSGLTTLLDDLRPEDRRRALYVGLTEVAGDCADEPPLFAQEQLSTGDVSADRLREWFRNTVEVRDADGAERILRAAVAADLDESEVTRVLVAAATDHRYLDAGHRIDFINKALETLDHVGWDRAGDVLPSLVPGLAAADRAEEESAWRPPVDVAQLCFDAAAELPGLVERGASRTWQEPEEFVDVLLGEDPHAIVDALTDAVAEGASVEELARVVAYAAARRVHLVATARYLAAHTPTRRSGEQTFRIAERLSRDEKIHEA
jgi:hypothetical protein